MGEDELEAAGWVDVEPGVGGGAPVLLGKRRERSAPVKSLARLREELLLGYCA
jgi:hypothetical protein